MSDKKYGHMDEDGIWIDELGDEYAIHINAMTAEGLHEKSEIAVELAWRDKQIAELEKAKNTLYKLKCECDKCGNVWTEQLYPVRAE